MVIDDLRPALIFSNLTVRQLSIILIMHQKQSMFLRDVAMALHVSRPVITRAWDALSALGLLERSHREKPDRRNVYAVLTSEGRKFAKAMEGSS
jgi:DNA-binding MarR family transcriptional regulator